MPFHHIGGYLSNTLKHMESEDINYNQHDTKTGVHDEIKITVLDGKKYKCLLTPKYLVTDVVYV